MTYLRLFIRLVATVHNWPVYVLQRLKLMKRNFRYELRSGYSVWIRPTAGDSGCLNDVWFDKSYDPNAYGIPFDWSSVKNVIDVGGHVGMATLFFAHKASHANIVTLEPDPENFIMLTSNVAENKLLDRVTLHNVGLGNGEPITLYIFPKDRGGNSVYRKDEGGTPVKIETISLATLMDKHNMSTVDFLKLDCEGAEYEALYTLSPDYLKRIRCIGMEYHHFSKDPRHNSDKLKEFLEQNGFTVVRHRKSMMLALRA